MAGQKSPAPCSSPTSVAPRPGGAVVAGRLPRVLDRYFAAATSAVFRYDGFVYKFVGDELVATFFPLLSGERFVARAVDAAEELLRATGHADPAGPWVPVGVGVHAGMAWFGSVGEGSHVEMTAVGDTVNTTARLASLAARRRDPDHHRGRDGRCPRSRIP